MRVQFCQSVTNNKLNTNYEKWLNNAQKRQLKTITVSLSSNIIQSYKNRPHCPKRLKFRNCLLVHPKR